MTYPRFTKLLVANRGEIALRIFHSCRDLGISTVAVFSDADAASAHVEAANEARPIGPAPARESYLDVRAVIRAAQETGAEAVHPGYGFLAENASFAEEVIEAGLSWIGPAPHVIRQMGDKQAARDMAVAAGVPVVPGSRRFAVGNAAEVQNAADAIGFPLLVKAVAGGGGIGMSRVDKSEDLHRAVEATQSMAAKAFGDGTIFLERFVARARHIEVQVFGFGDGRAIHLGERDCSLQRRFQKVVEESPAPGLPANVRIEMCDAAVRLARAIDYSGAGTVEFIVDTDSFEFFFLEMNTRIQVEHPVTEMVTGADLVAMQIELARGKLATINQEDVEFRGHAIECRLYAENPARMFLPSPGPLERLRFPAMEHLRIDSGYREGDQITPYYDPMIAKVIVSGSDREEACDRAIEALRKSDIAGVKTNRDFLLSCLDHPDFRAGRVCTAFIGDNLTELVAAMPRPVQSVI